MWTHALRLGVVLCASELVLVRITGTDVVAPRIIAVSAASFVVLALAPALALEIAPLPARLRGALTTILGGSLCALVGLGLVGPALYERGGQLAALAAAPALVVAVAVLSRRWPDPSGSPIPRPAAALSVVAGCALGAWGLGPGALPDFGTLLLILACFAGIGLLASRPRLTPLAGILGLAAASFPGHPTRVEWADREAGVGPDIVVISVDALRADAGQSMHVYQELAATGIQFTAAQSPAPWTLPALASLLTGVDPSEHGAGARPDGALSGIAEGTPALAQELAGRGYDTVGIAAPNPFAGASFGMDRGFDHFYQPGWSRFALPRGLQNLAACPLLARAAERWAKVVVCRSVDGEGVTDHAVEVLAQRRDRPLFLWIHYLDVHLPYVHTVDASVSKPVLKVVEGELFQKELRKLHGMPGLREQLWAANGDEVRFVDAQASRLVAALGTAPRGRLIVFTADHGEEFFEHGGFEHGHTVFQEVIHVPLVISRTGGAPTVVTEPVTLTDVTATLLGAAGGKNPRMIGADLTAPVPAARTIRSGSMLRVAPDRFFAIRRGAWKAIWDSEGPGALYDLSADPGETQNLAVERSDIFAELIAGQAHSGGEGGSHVSAGEDQKAMLEKLGYTAPAN